MIHDQALVASKHFLVETEDKNLVDNTVDPSIGDAHTECMGGGGCRCIGAACQCIQRGCRCLPAARDAGLQCSIERPTIRGTKADGDYMFGYMGHFTNPNWNPNWGRGNDYGHMGKK